MATHTYDYVIVGAGSAGCVLANRLSEDPEVSVLLLEAGGADTADFVHIPAAFAATFRSRNDWDLTTAFEHGADGRRIYLPRGKGLGGSSSINAMIYIRGNRRDWDEWAAEGCEGWDWAAIEPYFRRAEGNTRGADEVHGGDGPLTVSDPAYQPELAEQFVAAAEAAGYARTDDFNGPEQDGVGYYQTTTRDGKRCSAAVAYLHPVMDRPNLEVRTGVHVGRVVFEGTRAIGVEGERFDEPFAATAEREVLVCAGTYLTPQLLTLSGLGRPDELELLMVPVVRELTGVGLNLSDHPTVGGTWLTGEGTSLKDALTEENLGAWAGGEGPLTSNVASAGGFLRVGEEDTGVPDVQLHMVSAMFEQEGLVPPPADGFTLSVCLLRPRARGQVIVVSPDPQTKPYIDHQYLQDPVDVAVISAGMRAVLEIAAQSPLADGIQAGHMLPDDDSDEALARHVRHTMQTIYHPVGTSKMGPADDPMAVVDPECRVHGVEGLRVIDASVFPSTPRGNTNAPTIALAERAADLIRGRGAAGGGGAAASPSEAVPAAPSA